MILAYGVANLLQSVAAARTDLHAAFNPRLLLHLGRHRTYLVGLLCQFAGFALAFLARRDLPLFLVQSAMAAGLGVTVVLGVVILKWRLPRSELALLAVLCVGLTGLIISARPAESQPLGPAGVVWLVVALVAVAAGGWFAVRLHGPPGSVALGLLAGLAFGAAAVASRPLAAVHSLQQFGTDPLLYLVVIHSMVGQLLLGLAMQRGSTTAAVAAMDAAAAVPAAIIGLLFLGDAIVTGREWMAATGFLGTLTAVIGLTFYAEPQHHHAPVRQAELVGPSASRNGASSASRSGSASSGSAPSGLASSAPPGSASASASTASAAASALPGGSGSAADRGRGRLVDPMPSGPRIIADQGARRSER
jgi:drug/metabolite transporter (DMT)-like permease